MPVLIDTREGDKVDFWPLTDEAFDQARFARRAVEEFEGVRRLSAADASPAQRGRAGDPPDIDREIDGIRRGAQH